jgi:hypothetical protein
MTLLAAPETSNSDAIRGNTSLLASFKTQARAFNVRAWGQR